MDSKRNNGCSAQTRRGSYSIRIKNGNTQGEDATLPARKNTVRRFEKGEAENASVNSLAKNLDY